MTTGPENTPSPELPLTVTERRPIAFKQPTDERPRLAIIGCAGVVGTVTHRRLQERYEIRGLDTATHDAQGEPAWWRISSMADAAALDEAIMGADYVLIAATGIGHGWAGLQEVEIAGTAAACASAVKHKVNRLVLLSSNHATGMNEVDRWEGKQTIPATPSGNLRPDGLYGSSKVFAESVARSTSEIYGLGTSVIRLGAMRIDDDPSLASDGPRPSTMSDSEYAARMQAVWVSHAGWTKLLEEELGAEETFRLRYGSDRYTETPWTSEVMAWRSTP